MILPGVDIFKGSMGGMLILGGMHIQELLSSRKELKLGCRPIFRHILTYRL